MLVTVYQKPNSYYASFLQNTEENFLLGLLFNNNYEKTNIRTYFN